MLPKQSIPVGSGGLYSTGKVTEMLNLCFSGTAGGSLYHFRKEFGVEKNSVVYLDLYLHCGDISDPFVYETRREIFESLFRDKDVSKELYYDTINGFRKSVSDVKDVCIWYSRKLPDEYLGFMFLVDHLKGKCNIYYCDCSEMQGGLSEVQFEDAPHYIPEKVMLNAEETEYYSAQWQEIRKENGDLRIIKDGKIISVRYDSFDEKFLCELSNEPERASGVIGEIYSRNFLDQKLLAFVYVRISQLIGEGKILEAEKCTDDFSHSKICLNTDNRGMTSCTYK